ncbi:hypothetical protein [Gracilibacillus sp. YIM 98692]|uniref:hypothetical protein n=1 Tax=Gracilibacillus sp. YIM 98692 TaxID=2663532 RepID=UPI0013D699CC|nr:hypothetical protein [Gracilibacillus sp. YIM 98692]
MTPKSNERRWIVSSNSLTNNVLSFNSPWVVLWWSMAFPGYGHLLINHYLWGFILILFEFIFNNLGQINLAIFYSMLGDIEHAKEVLNIKWTLLYASVYVFTIADSYRRCVDNNKVYQLAYAQGDSKNPFQFSPLEKNLLEKREPLYTCFWSIIMPGLGSFISNRMPLFILSLIWWGVVIFYSNLYEAIVYSMIGDISKAKATLNPQWVLFIPSIYVFGIFSAYNMAVGNNKVYEMEKSSFLKKYYQKGELDSIYKDSQQEGS